MAPVPKHPLRHDLKAAPWLKAASLARVFAALDGGGETRIIGGAVRTVNTRSSPSPAIGGWNGSAPCASTSLS